MDIKEKYQDKIDLWHQVQQVNLDMVQRKEIFNYLREKDPKYLADLHCGGCVLKMFELFINELHTPDSFNR